MMISSVPRILYIEDYSDSCELISTLLFVEKCDYNFSIAGTPSQALKMIEAEPFDLYIMDYLLPEMTGAELCRLIRKNDPETPIIFFTGLTDEYNRLAAIKAGATDYLVKPNDLSKVVDATRRLFDKNLFNSEPDQQTKFSRYAA